MIHPTARQATDRRPGDREEPAVARTGESVEEIVAASCATLGDVAWPARARDGAAG